MGFVSEAQKEALFRNRDLYNEKRKTGEIVQDRSKVSNKQKKAGALNLQKFNKKSSVKSKIKEIKIIKAVLQNDTIKDAAKEVGISQTHAARLLHNVKQNGTLREAFDQLGWNADGIGQEAKKFYDYNKEEVTRVVGEGINAREIKEMRDASNSFKVLKLASEHISATANTIAQTGAGEVSGDIALLAIKNLITKLDDKQLRTVQESIQALLDDSIKVVSGQ